MNSQGKGGPAKLQGKGSKAQMQPYELKGKREEARGASGEVTWSWWEGQGEGGFSTKRVHFRRYTDTTWEASFIVAECVVWRERGLSVA